VWRYEVGVSVVEHDEPSLRERLADLGADEATDLLEHVYRFRGSVIEMLDDAKMWNHADDPNTGKHHDEDSVAGDGMSS
jgi:hypothetical protein